MLKNYCFQISQLNRTNPESIQGRTNFDKMKNLTQSVLVFGIQLMTFSREQLDLRSNKTTPKTHITYILYLIFALNLSRIVTKTKRSASYVGK